MTLASTFLMRETHTNANFYEHVAWKSRLIYLNMFLQLFSFDGKMNLNDVDRK